MLLSAFYKLPGLLASDFSAHANYEPYLVNLYSMAILTELNAYNIPNPLDVITLEKNYTNSPKYRADMHIDLQKVFDSGTVEAYGIKPKNWVEVKYYSALSRRKNDSEGGKASRVGQLLNDILRLCLYVSESQGKNRENGRFLLLVFNEKPRKYLAFSRKKSNNNRKWLSELLDYKNPGLKKISIKLDDEVVSVKNNILNGIDKLTISFECSVNSFYPLTPTTSNTEFYGFLINIYKYKIKFRKYLIKNDAFSTERWTPEMNNDLKSIVKALD